MQVGWTSILLSISLPTASRLSPVTTALPGLSPGAIAGIAVGTIVGLVLTVGFFLLVFFCGVLVAGRWTFSHVDMFTKCVGVYVWDNCNQLEKRIHFLHCCNRKVYPFTEPVTMVFKCKWWTCSE